MAQPLILTLLGVPIKLINFLTCVIGTVFYAPSYIYFLIIKSLVFNEQNILTKWKYIGLWLPRFITLGVGFYLFILQFYYPLRWYWEHDQQTGLKIKIASLLVSTGGFLFLMRRGYIKSLKYLNVPPLKSPKQHLYQFGLMIMDIPSIILGLLNLVMLTHAWQTLKYDYNPSKRNFFPHITRLVGASILINFQKPACLYLKLFPWRLKQSYEFTKQAPYTLQRNIILIFILFHTNVDILLFILIGWIPFVSPWKSFKRYAQSLSKQKCYSWRKTILSYSLLTLIQYFQLLILLFSTPVNLFKVIKIIKQTKNLKSFLNQKDSNGKYFDLDRRYLLISFYVLLQSILSIITFIAKIIIFLSIYKEKKYQKVIKDIQQKQKQQKQKQRVNRNPKDFYSEKFLQTQNYSLLLSTEIQKLRYALEFIIDIPFWGLVIINTIIKPWEYSFVKRAIDDKYNLQRGKIVKKVIAGFVLYLTGVLLVILLPLYLHRLPEVIGWFKNPTEEEKKLRKMKRLELLAVRIIKSTGQDVNSLLLWYSMFIFGASSTSKNTSDLRQQYQSLTLQVSIIYHKSLVKLTQRDLCEFYQLDKQHLTTANRRLKFWRTAHKIKNFRSYTNFLKLPIYLTYYLKSYYLKKITQIKEKNKSLQISNISKELIISRQILFLTLKLDARIIVQMILGFISLIIVSISFWRLPTLISFFKSKKYMVFYHQKQPKTMAMFKMLLFVFWQQIFDVFVSPMYLLAFILCPLRVLRYIKKFAYQYEFNNQNQLKILFKTKKKYFLNVILIPSLTNAFYIFQIIFIYFTIMRISYLRGLLTLQKQKLRTFFYHTIGIEQLPPLFQYEDSNSNTVLKIKRAIQFTSIQAFRDCIFLPFYIFPLFFPYRIMHVIHIWKTSQIPNKQPYHKIFKSGRRKQTLKLIGKIIKDDFICLILTLTLLLSIIRTHRAIILIIKNLKRNFTIKFLIYDYKKDLIEQNKLLFKDVESIFQVLLIIIYFIRIKSTYQRCKQLHKKHVQQRNNERQQEQIRATTKRLNKNQKFGNIGFINFSNICMFLEPNDINTLSRTSKDIYLWCQEEEMWQRMWEQRYKATSVNNIIEKLKTRCQHEYIRRRPVKQPPVTYHSIISEQFYYSLKQPFSFQKLFNIQLFSANWMQRNFPNDPDAVIHNIQNVQGQALLLTVIGIPIGKIVQFLQPYFQNNDKRYLKQLFVIIIGIILISTSLVVLVTFGLLIYETTKYIGIYLILLVWIQFFILFGMIYFVKKTQQAASLHPFDLPYIVFVIVKRKLIQFYQWVSDKSRKTYNFVVPKVKEVLRYVKNKLNVVKDYAVQTVKTLFQQVILPLYKRIANALRTIRDFLVSCWQSFKNIFVQFFNLFRRIFTAFKSILRLFTQGYLGILTTMMNSLLPLGILGDLFFTILALIYFSIPLILCYFFSWKSITIIPASILTLITIIKGYNRIKTNYQQHS